MNKGDRTREEMMKAVIELIEETGAADFPISLIAARADIAVGLVNYHYSSKQDLIVDAVKNYVEKYIQTDNVFMLSEDLEPRQLLIASFQSYANFLYNHSIICKLYIQYSLEGRIRADSLNQAMTYYLPIIESINPRLSMEQALIALMMISGTIQHLFLETEIANKTAGIHFDNPKERNEIIENMVKLTI